MRKPFFKNMANQPSTRAPGTGNAVPSTIHLPKDQYLHDGAPTEWWWHIGTLQAGDKTYGFEINAASFTAIGFTQVMLTDVTNQVHYHQTVPVLPPDFDPKTWAQSDPTQPWSVKLANVEMNAPAGADPAKHMHVKAQILDEATGAEVSFDLTFEQQGPPMLIWGTGVTGTPTPPTVETNNYYYSLTRLNATGTVTIVHDPSIANPPPTETIAVTGVTWMDHEYGLFENHGEAPSWILQDMHLDNGVTLSNYSTQAVTLDTKTASVATVQHPNGTTNFVDSFVTPRRAWTSGASGKSYFVDVLVEIPHFKAKIHVTALMDAQEFYKLEDIDGIKFPLIVYEGVAKAQGKFNDQQVTGTAWIENTPGA